MSVTIAVQLDTVESLAAELAALAAELEGDAGLCRSTARSLGTAVSGHAGERAEAAGAGWGTLVELIAQETSALATALTAAVASYRLADAALSDRLLALGTAPGPR